MHKRINPKILYTEIKTRIRGFYPYLLGFYVLSLLIACFSSTWSGFFYWPSFHIVVIVFTLIFVSTLEYNLGEKILSQRTFTKNENIKSVLDSGRMQLIRLVLVFFAVVNRLAWRLFNAIGCLIKNKIRFVSRRDWIKAVIVVAILLFAVVKGTGITDFLVIFYALVSFLFVLDSRWAASVALVLLASCPVLLILKPDKLAENVAIYAYYFLVITISTQIREIKQKKMPVDNYGE